MKTYHIFHAINPQFEENVNQQRKYAGSVEADSLEQAYFKSQNWERHWNQQSPCRSTSVGDVIQDEDAVDFLVAGVGFRALIEI